MAIPAAAFAVGLQVAPTSLSIPSGEQAGGLWLSNTGDMSINAQVRVFRWTQADGKDVLTPSQDLVVSPPMVQLGPAALQLIRVIRLGPPPSEKNASERAYRLIVNELPGPPATNASGQRQLQFLLRYSLPVFVEPADLSAHAAAYDLHWTVQRQGRDAMFEIRNTGRQHAQIAHIVFTPAKTAQASGALRSITVYDGLLGYVLPHQTMRFKIKLPPAMPSLRAGSWQVLIDGFEHSQRISVTGGHS